ncbi:MAG: DUF5655 domain-containing protein [Dehalococcoidia bacterium]
MAAIKLFRLDPEVEEIRAQSVAVEKSLQNLMEQNLEVLLGVRCLASEHSTGQTHAGRIDTLGLDENGSPVIIEYKRSLNETVINQGLFYLDWLLDHKAEFELLAQKKLGADVSDTIDWGNPRLLCIAGDFTRYEEHAVQQIGRSIELIRYRWYSQELLLLELVNVGTGRDVKLPSAPRTFGEAAANERRVTEVMAAASPELRDRFEALSAELMALGEDVQLSPMKHYFAFKRIKNFARVVPHPSDGKLLIYVKVGPESVELEPRFTRDMSNSVRWGSADLEITVRSDEDLDKARPLILRSYEAS